MNSRKICCVVPKCQKYLTNGVTIMYKFPRNEVRRRIWADQVARPNWTPTNDSLICEIHFEESEFEGKRKLRDDAVPTIFHRFDDAVENPLDTEGFLLVDTDSSNKIKNININDDLHHKEPKTSPKEPKTSPKYTTEFIPGSSRFQEFIQKDFKVEVTDELENTLQLQETQNFINVNAEIHDEDSANPPRNNISVETTKPVNNVNKYVNLNAKRKYTTTKDMYRKELEKVDISRKELEKVDIPIAKKPKTTEPTTKYGYLSIDELSKKLKQQNGKELPKRLKEF